MLTTSMPSGRPASAAAIWAKLVYTRSGARPRSAPESLARWASDERAPATSSNCPSMRAHRRCTAPMKAPRPPPTMPSRSGRGAPESAVASTMLGSSPPSGHAEHAAVRRHVAAGTGEIVECLFRDADDVVGDELRSFAGAVLGVLETAFPLQHRPAGIIVLGELREDRLEVHLTVAQRTEPSGPLGPRLEPAIHALAAGRVELGVLDVKHADPLVIDVDVFEIVELLQHEMAGIVQDVATLVTADAVEEHFEGHSVMQILARMDLEAGVDALVLEHIENRAPAPRQLVERRLDQTRRPLGPGIEIGPCQRARKSRVLGNAEPPRRPRRQLDLLDRPGGTRLRLAAHLRSRESVKRGVIGGMHGDQLALQMRRQLRHLEPALGQHAPHLVAVRLALGCLLEVEEPPVPAWDLHSLETEPGSPVGDGRQAVERRCVAGELRQENGRPFDRLHRVSPLVSHAAPLRERLHRRLLLRREVFGDVDLDLHILIAAPAVLLDSLPRDAELLPGLGTGWDPEDDAASIECLDFDLGAEQRLGQVHRHGADDVQPVAPEEPVGLDLQHHDDVAPPLRSLPPEAQLRAVLGARRNRDHESLLDPHLAAAAARVAALRRHLPLTAAHRARPVDREPALPERNHPASPALRARGDGRARGGAAAVTGWANLRHRQRDRHLAAERGDAEWDRDRGLDLVLVVQALRARRPPPAEDGREQVAEPAERAEIREIEVDPPGAGRTGASAPTRARVRAIASQLIVSLALVRIAQHIVRLVDLLEALRRLSVVGIAIGMVLLREPAERLLDLVHRRGLGDPQDLVIVLRRRHQPVSPSGLGDVSSPSRDRSPCHVSTTTRAGRISAPPSW